jgi:hypothetical protein
MAADDSDIDRVSRAAVIAYNEAINRRNVDALRELMTDGHAFIDGNGKVVAGKAEVVRSWRDFFNAFPDYRNDCHSDPWKACRSWPIGLRDRSGVGWSGALDGSDCRGQGVRVARV